MDDEASKQRAIKKMRPTRDADLADGVFRNHGIAMLQPGALVTPEARVDLDMASELSDSSAGFLDIFGDGGRAG